MVSSSSYLRDVNVAISWIIDIWITAHTYLSLVLTPSALEGVSVEVGYTDESTQVTDMDLVFI